MDLDSFFKRNMEILLLHRRTAISRSVYVVCNVRCSVSYGWHVLRIPGMLFSYPTASCGAVGNAKSGVSERLIRVGRKKLTVRKV